MDIFDNITKYRILSNGIKYRIEFLLEPIGAKPYWVNVSRNYIGCESYGYSGLFEPIEFDSKEDAINYIEQRRKDKIIKNKKWENVKEIDISNN